MPTKRPTTTAQLIQNQFSIPKLYKMPKVAIAIRTELRFVPTAKDFSNWPMPASSFVRMAKIPMIERMIPTAAISIGAITALYCNSTLPEET